MGRKKKADAIAVSSELETEFSEKRAQAQKILEVSANMVVADAASMAVADRRILAIHTALKELDERYEQLSRGHLDALEGIRSRIRPVRECLEGAKGALKHLILEFELKTKAAQTAALAAVNDGARDGTTLALAHGAGLVESAAVSAASEWCAEVHNPADVPEEYTIRVPDLAKLDALAKQIGRTGVMVVVPGVHFWNRPTGRVKG